MLRINEFEQECLDKGVKIEKVEQKLILPRIKGSWQEIKYYQDTTQVYSEWMQEGLLLCINIFIKLGNLQESEITDHLDIINTALKGKYNAQKMIYQIVHENMRGYAEELQEVGDE